jgi:hypothetical protein
MWLDLHTTHGLHLTKKTRNKNDKHQSQRG